MPRFELWVMDERGTLSIPREKHGKGDHSGFALPHSIKGWARIERRAIVLFRTDKGEPTPNQIRFYYSRRFPAHRIEDRYETLNPKFSFNVPKVRPTAHRSTVDHTKTSFMTGE